MVIGDFRQNDDESGENCRNDENRQKLSLIELQNYYVNPDFGWK